ncbi:hypothetical protein J4711_04830 [Staphylococcus epidermidis]|nr:hypothetical protein [Staphylococcus epidermidis]
MLNYMVKAKYFGETHKGTRQVEDYRLKLSPKKESQQYSIINKEPANEFKNSFTGSLLELCPNLTLIIRKIYNL